jgi:hypothetical protein
MCVFECMLCTDMLCVDVRSQCYGVGSRSEAAAVLLKEESEQTTTTTTSSTATITTSTTTATNQSVDKLL